MDDEVHTVMGVNEPPMIYRLDVHCPLDLDWSRYHSRGLKDDIPSDAESDAKAGDEEEFAGPTNPTMAPA